MDTDKTLAGAAMAIGRLAKDKRNAHGGYEYLSEEAVKAAVRREVAGRGFLPEKIHFELLSDVVAPYGAKQTPANTIKVRCTITIDGREIEGLGAGVDYADKALLKAQTAAVREAWKNLLVIATGHDPEADERVDADAPDATAPEGATESQLAQLKIYASHGALPENQRKWIAAQLTQRMTKERAQEICDRVRESLERD